MSDPTHVTLVTGGGRGIGASIARRVASSGDAVLVASRTLADCEAVADEIRAAGGTAHALELDVTDPASLALALARGGELAADVGPIDRLVNNAGIARPAKLLDGEAQGLYELHMDLNFHGARRVAEALLPSMLERGSGAIVNVASSAGLVGYPYVAAYCASKHALIGWARAAALELDGKGVRIATICPHFVDSPLLDASIAERVRAGGGTEDEVRASYAAMNPGGRLVSLDEVAGAVVAALASGRSGEIVELDGSDAPVVGSRGVGA